MAYQQSGSSFAVSRFNCNLEMLVFVEDGNLENRVTNPWKRDEEQETQAKCQSDSRE